MNKLSRFFARRRPHHSQRRSGAVVVEMAIILNVFMLLVLGMLDLGLATYRYNTLSQAARQGARQAIVHGSLAPPEMTAWGPATYTGTAGDGSAFAQAVSPMLLAFILDDVTIRVEWPDGGNSLQQRVRYTVTTEYHPLLTSFFFQQRLHTECDVHYADRTLSHLLCASHFKLSGASVSHFEHNESLCRDGLLTAMLQHSDFLVE